jgi:predicted acyl esterase
MIVLAMWGALAWGGEAVTAPLALCPPATVRESFRAPPPPYTISRSTLRMPDGVRLAVTWWRPVPSRASETFPVLLEYLPYRKDDSFYQRDFPLYDYFARRGFILAKVDIRGSGGSEGHLPPREYSDQELADADEIIRQLAVVPGSNGRVGMWGISWGGFNSLQVAMRHPPALKAIIALHASDDLFHDDVRYIDGILHMDPYTLEIDHENGLPSTATYALDSAYFRNRFEAYPWVLTYLKQPVDGPFWRRHALRWDYPALQVPTYLIGGLLDGYRDTPIRALDRATAPVKVEIGPWNHAWPDNGIPGPTYEWRDRAVRWWNQWLRDENTGLLDEPRLLAFVRDGHPPDANRTMTPGHWRFYDWPIAGSERRNYFPGSDGELLAAPGRAGEDRLLYRPGFGAAGGDWWGEPTGDMRPDDAGSLVYDSPVLGDSLILVGTPRVRLRVAADAPQANWIVRLEDVGPDGPVALVTGGAQNGTLRDSTTAARLLEPGRWSDLTFELHFTTWTFHPGHRIRIAVTNAQFPMLWPSPRPMTTRLALGTPATAVELPLVPAAAGRPADLPPAEPRRHRPDARDLPAPSAPQVRVSYEQLSGRTTYDLGSSWAYRIGARRFLTTERESWWTTDADPGQSGFLGQETHRITAGDRTIELTTTIDITSDSMAIRAVVTRKWVRNGAPVRSREWRESFPRLAH